jgi:hypothetical protein
MVYSQTKRTASVSSITNRASGGGDKKAGLAYAVAHSAASFVALRGTKQNLSTWQMPMTTNVRPSRPVGVTPGNGRYYKSV